MPTLDQLKFTFPGQSALLGGLRKSKFEGRSRKFSGLVLVGKVHPVLVNTTLLLTALVLFA